MVVDLNLVNNMGVDVGFLWAVINEKGKTNLSELYPDIKLNNPPIISENTVLLTAKELKNISGWTPDKQKKLLTFMEEAGMVKCTTLGVPPKRCVEINDFTIKQKCNRPLVKENKEGWIYYLCTELGVKIGRTIQKEKRESLIGTKLPLPIYRSDFFYVSDRAKAEKRLHKEFKQYRGLGEWFDINGEHMRRGVEILRKEFKGIPEEGNSKQSYEESLLKFLEIEELPF